LKLLVRWLPACAFVVVACAQVLGIEDAALDPRFATEALCNEYCNTVEANCTGEFDVYTSPDTCRGVCSALQPGEPGVAVGNTIHCRLANAKAAESTQEFGQHCPAAGPGGDGICGENCESYCTVLEKACPNEFARFDGAGDCVSECEANVPDLGGFDISQDEGNSMQCRLYHVSAASDKPVPHCKHAIGDELCVPGEGGSGGGG
jgi:hypothetical protein